MLMLIAVVFIVLCLVGAVKNFVDAVAKLIGLLVGIFICMAVVVLAWQAFVWIFPYALVAFLVGGLLWIVGRLCR